MRITYPEQLFQRIVSNSKYLMSVLLYSHGIRMWQIRSVYHFSHLTVGVSEASLICPVICKTNATVRHFEEKKDVGTLSHKGKPAKQTFVPWNCKRGLLTRSVS